MDFLCFDFINSQWYKTHDSCFEALRDEKWIGEFCVKWGLNIHLKLSGDQFEQLISLRTLLFDIIVDIDTYKEIGDAHMKEFNLYLSMSPLKYVFQKEENAYTVILEPIRKNWEYLLHKIAASLAEVISEYGTGIIRACDNPECRWVFLDNSRNHSRKWCSNTCSSLIKVRRFREKKKR